MQEPIIQIRDLYKAFNTNIALNRISLDIPRGKMYGLLGPNGAGKTTLIRIITQILESDSGQVIFDGKPLSSSDVYKIGYMPEERGLYKKMRVGEQLTYLARLKDLSAKDAKKNIDFWMDRLDILDWKTKKVEELSKGMQQKIQFVATVMHDPQVLILDEPFSGLDPVNTNLIKQEISTLQAQGTSIIFSTHRMEQVEAICEDIVLINEGNIVLDGKVSKIKEDFKQNHFEIHFEGALEDNQIPGDFELIQQGDKTLHFRLQKDQNANSLMRSLLNNNIEIHGVSEILPGLNEIFIQKVGKQPILNETEA
ncbi:MAG: ABC transporter ATP-binding protein [Bacteroidetes bacterium]|nr:ABC transporter ATP-binding protein [Bacteroidota bacterium]